MAYLTLARSELPENLRDTARLYAASEECVELFRSGGDGNEFRAPSVHLRGSCEAHWH